MRRLLSFLLIFAFLCGAPSALSQGTNSNTPDVAGAPPTSSDESTADTTGASRAAEGVANGAIQGAEDAANSVEDRPGIGLREAGFDINALNPNTNLPTFDIENSDDPLEVVDSILLRYIINPIFFLAGGVAVLVIMYSSFRIVTSRGEEEGLTAAKNTLIWAAAGLALVLLAYTIVGNLVTIVLQQL